jgi:T5SS/PEP-CTERM-associated repeat protein
MAKIFLDVDERFTVSGDDDQVLGRGGNETVLAEAGVTGTRLDGNIERLDIAANSSEVVLRVNSDGRFEIVSNDQVLTTFTGGLNQAVDLRFRDGNATLAQIGATSFEVSNPATPQEKVVVERDSKRSADAIGLGAGVSEAGSASGSAGSAVTTEGPIYFDNKPIFSDPPDTGRDIDIGRDEKDAVLRIASGDLFSSSGRDAGIAVSPGNGYEYDNVADAPSLEKSSLEIVNGSEVRISTDGGFGGLLLGDRGNGNGRALIQGDGTELKLLGEDADLSVGQFGDGEMVVANGARVDLGAGNHVIGNASGSTGTLSITGSGTRLDAANDLYIGNGSFDNQNNNDPGDDFGVEGAPTQASMTVTDNAAVKFVGDDTGIRVGNSYSGMAEGSKASLTLTTGGTLETPRLEMGGPDSALTVEGADTSVVVSSRFGRPWSDGSPQGGYVRLADREADSGTMTIRDGAHFTVSAAQGTSGPGFDIARDLGSQGSLTLDGEKTLLEVIQTTPTVQGADWGPELRAGDAGEAQIEVKNGAKLRLDGPVSDLEVGKGNADDFDNLTDAPALSQSRMIVSDGGQVVVAGRTDLEPDGYGDVDVGDEANGNGSLQVKGQGTRFSAKSADVNVGYDGKGELRVQDGAVFEILTRDGDNDGSGMTLGYESSGQGDLVVDDATVTLRAKDNVIGEYGPYLFVGANGEGRAELQNNAELRLAAPETSFYVGRGEDETTGSGVLDIVGGSTLRFVSPTAGEAASADKELGHGMDIGRDGATGTVTISDGGALEMVGRDDYVSLELGRKKDGNTAGEGSLRISGAESRLEVRNERENGEAFIGVGRDGTGTLIVEDGATLKGGPFMNVGDRAGGNGTYTLTGEGTSAALSGQARVEDGPLYGAFFNVAENANSTGNATISDGASMTISTLTGTFTGLQIADGVDTVGELTISGAGSSLTIEGNGGPLSGETAYVEIGAAGSATLTIAEGGSLVQDPNGIVAVGTETGGSGRVEVTGDGSLFDAGGVMVIGAPTLSDDVVRGDIALTGGGEGRVTVGSGATLRAGAAEGDGVDDIFIGEQGSLRIEDGGTVAADVVNDAGGTLVTGNSPGWARIDGDLDWRGDLAMEFAGADESAYDRLDITGEAAIDGLITLDFSLDQGLRTGDQFAVIETAQGLDLDGADIAITGLAGTLEARTTITDTALQVELV